MRVRLETILVASAIALAGCGDRSHPPNTLPPATPIAGQARGDERALRIPLPIQPHLSEIEEQRIEEAAQRLSITPIMEQTLLWQSMKAPAFEGGDIEFVRQKGEQFANTIILGMKQSGNEELEHAAKALRSRDNPNGIPIEVVPLLPTRSYGVTPLVESRLERNENQINQWLVLGALVVLTSDPLDTAMELTFAVATVEKLQEQYNRLLPNISSSDLDRLLSPLGKEEEDERNIFTNTVQARALIRQRAFGPLEGVAKIKQKAAAKFVEFGEDETDPRWIAYIRDITSPSPSLDLIS